MSEQKNQKTRKWWLKRLLLLGLQVSRKRWRKLLTLLGLYFLVFVFFTFLPDEIIAADSGQDVTLTCRAPNNNINIVEWNRADLRDEYVLLYMDGHLDPDNQHPSFKNRVDLQDRQMKDGDVSLILKDVTINDTGTYKCRVAQREPNQERPILKNITIIYLHVVPPGQTQGLVVGLNVGLSVSAVLLVAVVGFRIYRRCKLNPADPHVAEHLQRLQPEYPMMVTAESGQDVTLTCRAVKK